MNGMLSEILAPIVLVSTLALGTIMCTIAVGLIRQRINGKAEAAGEAPPTAAGGPEKKY